jgi:hypothetical protein
MAYRRAASALKAAVLCTLVLAAAAWVIEHLQPPDPATLADDPIRQIAALAQRHRSLPWRDVPLRRLGPACDHGDPAACADLAFAYADVRAVAAEQFDLELPCADRALLVRACEGGDARSCMFLGHLANGGDCEPRDEDRARALYERACSQGLDAACAMRDALDG